MDGADELLGSVDLVELLLAQLLQSGADDVLVSGHATDTDGGDDSEIGDIVDADSHKTSPYRVTDLGRVPRPIGLVTL